MAYVTGSAADMAAVKTALVNACTANGWTEQTDAEGKTVLIQDDSSLADAICVRVEVTANGPSLTDSLELLGRTGLDSGDAPRVVSMSGFKTGDTPEELISYPVTYFAFVYLTEVFFVINYSNSYQWCAFGQSQQNGLPGTGNWVAATCGAPAPDKIFIGSVSGGSGDAYKEDGTPAALFWSTGYETIESANAWVHNNIDSSYPWALGNTNTSNTVGPKYFTELLNAQPNQFSGEGVLLPIRAYKTRPDSKVSQIAELEYARHVRIDNYTDEQTLTLGTDEWMIFPYKKKNTSERNGGGGIMHTGTFGWALKKA